MSGLLKFVEHSGFGEKSGRTAYVFKFASLPPPNEGMNWHAIDSFNAAEELLADTGLGEVFKTAIDKGCALVTKRPD
jgi:hypothetical protein